jgi:hypothetical protein
MSFSDDYGSPIMAKRKNDKSRPTHRKEDEELYAKMRQKFTAADLQKYTEIEEGIPAEQVLAEMEEIHRKVTRKRG